MILCDPTDCSLPGSSVHGISQARILEWVAISFSRGSSWPRDQTRGSCIGRRTLLPLSHQGRVKCSEVKEDCCYSVAQLCRTLCNPMDCSTPGLPVHQLPEFTQTHVHWVGDAIQLSYPLLTPSLPAFNLSQHQGVFKWVSALHQVAKILEFQLQHQSFQWTLRIDLL